MGSRGRGPQQLKFKAWKAAPYRDPMDRIYLTDPVDESPHWPPKPGSRCPCDNHGPSEGILDPQAEAAKRKNSLEGGFDPVDLCTIHSISRAVNGRCNFCELGVGTIRLTTVVHGVRPFRDRRTFGSDRSRNGLPPLPRSRPKPKPRKIKPGTASKSYVRSGSKSVTTSKMSSQRRRVSGPVKVK